MNNKIDIDRMAYLIGEEDAMEELDKFTEPHNFSKKYESEKMKMIKKVNRIDPIPMPNRKGKGMAMKKTIVLIAAIIATLALSITAYGICNFLLQQIEMKKRERLLMMCNQNLKLLKYL